jgi:hypothetical protein
VVIETSTYIKIYERVKIVVCQSLAADQWFSPGTPISSVNQTDRHDITEILLKAALCIIAPKIVLP